MKAMIFSAGKGTRLGSITNTTPKALLEAGGKSFLRLAVEKVQSHGFDDIIVNIHHHPKKMIKEIENLRNEGFRIEISDESECILETGGGLFKARWFFNDMSPFLLYNVDVITDLNISSFCDFHISRGGIATLAVMEHRHDRCFLTSGNGVLSGWCNVKTGDEIVTRNCGNARKVAFTGIHMVDPLIFKFMNEGVYSMTDLYLRISAEKDIFTYLFNGSWLDIGSEESLREARERFRV